MKINIYIFLCAPVLTILASSTVFASNIPTNYVATPGGYTHPDCINVLENGESINADGTILQTNGSNRNPVNCSYPKYLKNGTEIKEDTPLSDRIFHSWEASISNSINESHGITNVIEEWDVPEAPYYYNGQTLYAFTSIRTVNTIIQPVLGFNQGGTDGPQWSIANWSVVNGAPYKSQNVHVNPGDRIRGEMTREVPVNVDPKAYRDWTLSISVLKGNQETHKQVLKVTLNDSNYTFLDRAVYETYRDRNFVECFDIAKQKNLKPMEFAFTGVKLIWRNGTPAPGSTQQFIYDRDCGIKTSVEPVTFSQANYKILY